MAFVGRRYKTMHKVELSQKDFFVCDFSVIIVELPKNMFAKVFFAFGAFE